MDSMTRHFGLKKRFQDFCLFSILMTETWIKVQLCVGNGGAMSRNVPNNAIVVRFGCIWYDMPWIDC